MCMGFHQGSLLKHAIGILFIFSLLAGCSQHERKPEYGSTEWAEYLGGPERNHYSPLKQIDTSNVQNLKVAWQYSTGDSGQMQCNPIIVNGILYGMTAATEPFALDAASGKKLWDWKAPDEVLKYNTSRGVTYWENLDDKRILFSNSSWLYAVNAMTGKGIMSFGDSGRVSLKTGLGASAEGKIVVSNTPGTVFENLIIMPLRVHENSEAALGHIQAFDILTGKLAWVFHTIPFPGEEGFESWENKKAYLNEDVGGANNWSGMAIDRKRGIIYIPTGSAAFDYYGGNRNGDNLFANCLLALDAKTGKRKWHFQIVHHDILDRDLPAPPNLVTVRHDGKLVDAVAQVTKHGFVFLFDRENGNPLFPIEEHPVPSSDIPGEKASATQPIPLKPASYARQKLTEADINPSASNRDEILEIFRKVRNEGPFTPLSERGTIVFPGLDGGAEWGGAAASPDGILYLNSNEMAWLLALGKTKNKPDGNRVNGEAIYSTNCAVCHGDDRKGNPLSGFPSLVNSGERRSARDLLNIITNGKGRMPAFSKFSADEKKALVTFLTGKKIKEEKIFKEPGLKPSYKTPPMPYQVSQFSKFLDSKGNPAITPPWGTLNAIDLNTGEYVWKVPFGSYPELEKEGVVQTGAESYGGPVLTASGLLFIAGTKDKNFHAYDMKNGKLLWKTQLPAAGFATPSTYEVNGKQYIVIACGGSKLGAPAGDTYVAFSLP